MRFLTTHSWVECCFSGFFNLWQGLRKVGRDYRWSTCVYTKNVGHVVYIRHCKGKVADSWFSSHSWPYLVVRGQDMYARVGDPPHLIHSATWMLCTVYIIILYTHKGLLVVQYMFWEHVARHSGTPLPCVVCCTADFDLLSCPRWSTVLENYRTECRGFQPRSALFSSKKCCPGCSWYTLDSCN